MHFDKDLIRHLLNKRLSYKCLYISYFFNQRENVVKLFSCKLKVIFINYPLHKYDSTRNITLHFSTNILALRVLVNKTNSVQISIVNSGPV